MTLDDALDQIADIRSQMASTRVFRGFRSATTLFSAMVAIVIGRVQSLCMWISFWNCGCWPGWSAFWSSSASW
jgi:hypothetical protein